MLPWIFRLCCNWHFKTSALKIVIPNIYIVHSWIFFGLSIRTNMNYIVAYLKIPKFPLTKGFVFEVYVLIPEQMCFSLIIYPHVLIRIFLIPASVICKYVHACICVICSNMYKYIMNTYSFIADGVKHAQLGCPEGIQAF